MGLLIHLQLRPLFTTFSAQMLWHQACRNRVNRPPTSVLASLTTSTPSLKGLPGSGSPSLSLLILIPGRPGHSCSPTERLIPVERSSCLPVPISSSGRLDLNKRIPLQVVLVELVFRPLYGLLGKEVLRKGVFRDHLRSKTMTRLLEDRHPQGHSSLTEPQIGISPGERRKGPDAGQK